MQTFFNQPLNRALGSLVLLGVVLALAMYSYTTYKQSSYVGYGPTTISVTGEGEVLAVPDIGQFTFSVEVEAEDATAAQSGAAEQSNAILAYLTEQGIAEADVKTQNYSLYPRYRYEEEICPVGVRCPGGQRVQDGFTVNQSVQVKVRDTENAGELLVGIGELGATNVSGLQFTIDDPSAVEAEARALAIADAEAKAAEMAEDLGVRIVRMTNFYEEERYKNEVYGMGGDMVRNEMAMMDSAPDLPMGEAATQQTVNITYEVR